jgi:hypothetical protein
MVKKIIIFFILFVAVYSFGQSEISEHTTKNKASQILVSADSSYLPKDSLKNIYVRLSIKTVPDSAEIILDSIVKGMSPLIVDSVFLGKHSLIVRKNGYFGKKMIIALENDTFFEINISLVKPGSLIVTSTPSDAIIYMNNKELGKTPYINSFMKPQEYIIKCVKDSFEAYEQKINVIEGKRDSIHIDLKLIQPQNKIVKKEDIKKKIKLNRVTAIITACLFASFLIFIFAVEINDNLK